jgi:RNA polymerase sigma factor (sigma-70 family)
VKFLPFVYRIARRHPHNCWIQVDDLESVAAMALMRAVRRYTPARESTWKGYLTTLIKGALNDYMRTWDGVRNRTRRERPAEFDVACTHPFTAELENRELAARLLGSLKNDRERKVTLWYFGYDMTLAEIGKRLGLSEARVHVLLKRARIQLTGTAENLHGLHLRARWRAWSPRKPRPAVPGIEARNAKIRARYARGDISQTELARRFKLSQGYVWKLLRERRA